MDNFSLIDYSDNLVVDGDTSFVMKTLLGT